MPPLPVMTVTPDTPPRHMVGYARVSMSDQDTRRQIDELVRFGVAESDIYKDTGSGRTMNRAGWRSMWKDLRAGDLLVVHSLDRMGRDLIELAQTVEKLHVLGANLKIITMDLDTRSPTGRLIFNIMASMAQWERELIVERTRHGLAAARARGHVGGAVQKIADATIAEMTRRNAAGESVRALAAEFGISRAIFYKRSRELRRDSEGTAK